MTLIELKTGQEEAEAPLEEVLEAATETHKMADLEDLAEEVLDLLEVLLEIRNERISLFGTI